jgi:nucleoside-diphosphate-sugar epimerase
MSMLIFGCGYLGERVARRWRAAGRHVVVATRHVERASDFQRRGYGVILADVTRPESLTNLPQTETVLFAVGHDRTANRSIEEVYVGGVRNVLAALPAESGRLIYISTTGVYGDAKGDWVDEETPPDPQRDGGRASWSAEQLLTAHPLGARSIILRLAGIYGPGRVPFLRELRAGEPIPAPSAGHLNLIHVDDAATAVVAAAEISPRDITERNRKRRVYCVSDGHPVRRGEFYQEVARQVGAPPPQFVEPDPASPRAARAAADRRVRNDRMLAELCVELAYPNYRAGLAALLETQNQQSNC